MISIIIPTYQEGGVLPRTIKSILAQTFHDIEIIIVDDGSTDGTEAFVAPFYSVIRYFKEPHRDRQATRNTGLAYARGEYVLVCDADIVMRPDMLEKMHRALQEHPEASFVYSAFHLGWKKFPSIPFDPALLRQMNYINMATLVRREHFPRFDEEIGRFQDWDMWLTMVGDGRTGIAISEVLFSIGHNKYGLSSWLPRFAYRIPWNILGVRSKNIELYEEWKKKVQKKHGIP